MSEHTPDPPPEIAALLAAQEPHVCRSCGGSGWVDDENWSGYPNPPYVKGYIPVREEWDGLVPCGRCGGGHDLDRDERTEPTMVVDGWNREQEARVVELLRASVVRTDPDLADRLDADADLLDAAGARIGVDGVKIQLSADTRDTATDGMRAAARALRGEAPHGNLIPLAPEDEATIAALFDSDPEVARRRRAATDRSDR